MLGLHCKIGFGRRIDFEGEVWVMVGLARFASKPKKTTTTSLCIVVSPLECGRFSQSGMHSPKAMGGAKYSRIVVFNVGKPEP
jgi:hypothetical protein